jgi:uncharacterized protein YndB with AHSA1/START domain
VVSPHQKQSLETIYLPTVRLLVFQPSCFLLYYYISAHIIWKHLDPTEPGLDSSDSEFDFRVGGHERFSVGMQGVSYRYDATYYDIVPQQRIIYSYEMYADSVRSSVSVATIEFVPVDGGTALAWTEQGAYLNGIDGAEAPHLRRGGTSEMLDGLAKYLG